MIEREDAERLRKVGRLGQIDEDDPSFLFRIAKHIEIAFEAGLLPDFDLTMDPDTWADAERIKEALGFYGSLLSLTEVEHAWQAYSTALSASWLVVSDASILEFAGWLCYMYLEKLLRDGIG